MCYDKENGCVRNCFVCNELSEVYDGILVSFISCD